MKKISGLTILFLVVSAGAFAQTPTPTPTPYSQPTPSWVLSTERLAGQGSTYGDIINRPARAIFGQLQGLWALFQVSMNADGTIKPEAIPTPTPAPTATPAPTPTPFAWVTGTLEVETLALDDPAPTPVAGGALLFGQAWLYGAKCVS